MPLTVRPARPEETAAVLAAYRWLFAPPGSVPSTWDEPRARATVAAITRGDQAQLTLLVAVDEEERLAGLCSVAIDLLSVRFGLRAWVEDLLGARLTPAGRTAQYFSLPDK